ncbi:hypothetical protein PG994_005982 [Apiospora phragmitis]|uniref:Zn(2)-C6 fungal-type domain-containing protein n=1 Tax=Apiospora phragmitis TaxID=2905665 RepID=A0ABR1VGC7_9PEZI
MEHLDGEPGSQRYRKACNHCHLSKLRCSGSKPCERCRDNARKCVYSVVARLGKPKGTCNKRTLLKLQQRDDEAEMAEVAAVWHEGSSTSVVASPPTPLSPAAGLPNTGQILSDWSLGSDQDYFDTSASSNSMEELSDNMFQFDNDTAMVGYEGWDAYQDFGHGPDLSSASANTSQLQQYWSEDLTPEEVSCDCLHTQFNTICHLKAVSDIDFTIILNALSTCLGLASCPHCQLDHEATEMILMAMRLLWRRLQQHQPSSLSSSSADGGDPNTNTTSTTTTTTSRAVLLLESDMRLNLQDQTVLGREALSLVRATLLKLASDNTQQTLVATGKRVSKVLTQRHHRLE